LKIFKKAPKKNGDEIFDRLTVRISVPCPIVVDLANKL
jgi:hypothetical protein